MSLRHTGPPPNLDDGFVVPKGAPVHSTKTGEWKPAGRAQTIYPWGINRYTSGTVVSWAGAQGYWRRVSLTPNGEFVAHWPGDPNAR